MDENSAPIERDGGGDDEPSKVAALLHAARTRAGIDLRDVADRLRIRYLYLEAIEDGRFGDLPGPTYALGFVRAYADFLDLDGKEIVRQFKDEGQGLIRRQELVFPEPIQEGRFPGTKVLVVALILAGVVYGGWYYWQPHRATPGGEIAQVPGNLMALIKPRAQTTPGSAPASPALASTSTPQTPGSALNPSAATAMPSTGSASSEAPSSSAPSPSTPTASPESTSPSSANRTPAAAVPAASVPASSSPEPQQSGSSQATAAKPASKPIGGAESPSASGPATPSTSPAPEQVASKPGEPKVYGDNGASHVTLTAKQDSWLQVRDKTGAVVWTRILRAGDSYKVPDQSGLTLVTGNAGALQVTVDGKDAPALGAVGAVRRNIALDPDKLAAGKAGGQ